MLTYVTGNCCHPLTTQPVIIAHICNTAGKWGKGFVLELSKKWPLVKEKYLQWYQSARHCHPQQAIHQTGPNLLDSEGLLLNQTDLMPPYFALGSVQFVPVDHQITIANMVAQFGIQSKRNPIPVRYDALNQCLAKVKAYAVKNQAEIHCPKIGTGLGGGDWSQIEPLLSKIADQGLSVVVYEYLPQIIFNGPTASPYDQFFSNFAPVQITVQGITYPSAEHVYQAAKTKDLFIRKQIAALPTAAAAKTYGRRLPLRDDWNEIRYKTMVYILKLKFSQEPFRSVLLQTGSAELVESAATWDDQIWGVGRKGTGQNLLGKALMEVRSLI